MSRVPRPAVLLLGLGLSLGCGGANPDIRTDRTLAVLEDEHGKRLVLVSEEELATAPSKFRPADGTSDASEWSNLEMDRAFNRLIEGGHCRISGAVIPPMAPQEAKGWWRWMVCSSGWELRKQNPDLPLPELEREARAYVADSYPLLVGLAQEFDPDLTLQDPPKVSD